MAVQSDKLRLLRRIPQIRFEEELRGYSKSQVDRVLENLAPLADEIEVLQQQLAEAEQRAASAEAAALQSGSPAPIPAPVPVAEPVAPSSPQPPEDFDEQLREVMLMAQRTAKDRVETAEADAEQIRAESKANADSLMASARTEAQELKGEAHAQRELMLSEAEEDRAGMLESANADAEERRQAVEAQLVESEGALRDDLLVEIKDLRDKRSQLSQDLELFEQHLSSRREVVKTALAEIDQAIEDPEKLRENEVLEQLDVPEIDEAELTEISVESEALSELSGEAAKARDALAAANLGSPQSPIAGVADPVQGGTQDWVAPEVTPVEADTSFFATEAVEPVPSMPEASVGEIFPPEPVADADFGGVSAPEIFTPEMSAPEIAPPAMDIPEMPAPEFSAPSQDFAPDPAAIPSGDSLIPEDQGFFTGSDPQPEAAPISWDAPEAEIPAPMETNEPAQRGGLLSGLLGGRRSSEPAAPEVDPGEYLPPPAPETTGGASEAISGLRSRLSGGGDSLPNPTAESSSLADAAMDAVTEATPEMPANVDVPGFDAPPPAFEAPAFEAPAFEAPTFDAPTTDGGGAFGDIARDAGDQFTAPDVDARPSWADAVPEDLAPPTAGDALGGRSGDQYLEELRRVTGDDAVTDESDEALNRFLSEDEDQGGGWFGRRK